jgi:hypothetical protein
VVRKAEREGGELFCKPCRNRTRFAQKSHPTKGTGVKNDESRLPARNSYYKAKRRCTLGARHHPAYAAVQFRFTSFEQFFELLGPKPKGCSLDRINPLGHYEPGNVRWATVLQQAQNRMPRGYWINDHFSRPNGLSTDGEQNEETDQEACCFQNMRRVSVSGEVPRSG